MLKKLLAGCALVALTTAGCSSKDDDSSTTGDVNVKDRPTAASGTLSLETAKDFATDDSGKLTQNIHGSLNGKTGLDTVDNLDNMNQTALLDLNKKRHAALWKALNEADTNCEGSNSGDTNDADQDKIPVNVSTTFNCDSSQNNFTFKMSGGVTMQDKNDSDVHGGFKITIDDNSFTFGGADGQLTINTNADIETTRNGNRFTTKTELGVTFSGSSAEGSGTVGVGQFFDITYDAAEDGNDDPFDAGVISTLDGFYKIAATGAEGSVDFTMKLTGSELDVGDCDNGFKSGILTLTDGDGNKLEGTFSNCTATWTYNGTAI